MPSCKCSCGSLTNSAVCDHNFDSENLTSIRCYAKWVPGCANKNDPNFDRFIAEFAKKLFKKD